MTVLRATFAALLGALVAVALYLVWFFGITHHDPTQGHSSLAFIVISTVVAAVCGFIGGYLGAVCAPATPRGVADAIAALIVIIAIFGDRHTPGQNHWAWLVFLFAAGATAYGAGRLRKPVPHTHL